MKLISKRLNGYNQSTHHHNPGSRVMGTERNKHNTHRKRVLFLSQLVSTPYRKYGNTDQKFVKSALGASS